VEETGIPRENHRPVSYIKKNKIKKNKIYIYMSETRYG
jgi:hypothetical protein